MFVYKGRLKKLDDLPKGELPDNAVTFKEPKNLVQVNLLALVFIIPALILIIGICIFSVIIGTRDTVPFINQWLFLGMILSFLFIPVHELLHGICFEKNAVVEFYYSPLAFLTFSLSPVSKKRFIFMSLCPQLVLGWLPLILWAFIPFPESVGDTIYFFGLFSAISGCGDDINVFNAIRQMPKGSIAQMSGVRTYWFMPE